MKIETTYIQNLLQNLEINQDFDGNELKLDEYIDENNQIRHPKHGNIVLQLSARVKVFGFVIWSNNESWETGREVILDDYKVLDQDGDEVELSKLQYRLIEKKVEGVLRGV